MNNKKGDWSYAPIECCGRRRHLRADGIYGANGYKRIKIYEDSAAELKADLRRVDKMAAVTLESSSQ